METIAVVDYNLGNLHSVSKAVEHVAPDARVLVTDDHAQIAQADRVVFPGQGAARDCMKAISDHHVEAAVREAAEVKPFLGICMGLQVLMEYSDENGGTPLLDLFPGQVRHFARGRVDDNGVPLKIPHMGWSQVNQAIDHPMWQGIDDQSRFYFVHSYYIVPDDESIVAATTDYIDPFACAIASDNLFAVQFHPEKSADAGLQLLKNFVNWKP
ncbi:imidazole glycerol phosphate synthase subunit HisH [Solemya velum gill symbiont]|uniref:imidazole glycerol phosphate synthase subunit HisH n=1 Tax=Solemya velum gill symbiont TaxID=2340 RepID=UPI0009985833|nr:imidazole glycerol phosphate synthase subunit HisH [Solemya velum gill symbiont]OOY98945.1 imidazole glycerol phosphate synthase subunit HisH [Solemya velum gill symbiont]OOZ01212.1 imidazole glycerol phosphate synthase subunit HisH [Solemya velum gill symbiont]OOZ03423.1 imidazole glycerol phosphate synthase subunit HisH [Solemya velum gill symbiont]OOZ05677.1 imidazole glycerol phosphate synthase subunit HisH [Solemya velum gill symbiont]OOZ07903.1 imidazole glycerol phosphate synthase su